ncbi:peptidoglycan DD-metalloendopeptidase family protein [Vibrio alginolyticus]
MSQFKFIVLIVAVFCFSVALLLPTEDEPNQDSHSTQLNQSSDSSPPPSLKIVTPSDVSLTPLPKPKQIHYIVKVGDTLSGIFAQLGLPYGILQQILSVDLDHLQLDMIKPGEELELVMDDMGQLSQLIYHMSLVEKAIYTRENDGSFSYEFQEISGEWRETLFSGEIEGSFSVSAHRVGLTSGHVANITQVMKDKIDFARSLRAGDRFDILVKQQYLGEHKTGNSEIKAISFNLAKGEVAAFLAEDGRFYDRAGNSLERAFNRYPVDRAYRRITSGFNPKRKHPVTGRVTPHNGTDFATPIGAPVYSTGDGKVIAVRKHPYAGNYLVIEHNSVYKTRYLHLNKILVKKGQVIKRGQKIALSGNTGRSTGPHLHFEVLVRNRPVDAMKADLPIAKSLPNIQKPSFLARVSEFDYLVETKN